jgi:hypothetical protein
MMIFTYSQLPLIEVSYLHPTPTNRRRTLNECHGSWSLKFRKEAKPMSTENTGQGKSKLIEQVRLHDHHDPHHGEFRLSDVILGGQDGLVNVLGVILGVAAATQDARILIAAGLAATFAESISMGAVAYTSTLAENATVSILFFIK